MPLTGLYMEASSSSFDESWESENVRNWEIDRDTKKERWEKEGKKGNDRVGEIWLHIHLMPLPLLITLQRGVWNRNTLAHWHISLGPFLRADTQEENPLTLPGLLQTLAGLSCKAGRHTETAGFNTLWSPPWAHSLSLMLSCWTSWFSHAHYFKLLHITYCMGYSSTTKMFFFNNGSYSMNGCVNMKNMRTTKGKTQKQCHLMSIYCRGSSTVLYRTYLYTLISNIIFCFKTIKSQITNYQNSERGPNITCSSQHLKINKVIK